VNWLVGVDELVPGLYAMALNAELPLEVREELEENDIQFRDTSNEET